MIFRQFNYQNLNFFFQERHSSLTYSPVQPKPTPFQPPTLDQYNNTSYYNPAAVPTYNNTTPNMYQSPPVCGPPPNNQYMGNISNSSAPPPNPMYNPGMTQPTPPQQVAMQNMFNPAASMTSTLSTDSLHSSNMMTPAAPPTGKVCTQFSSCCTFPAAHSLMF